MTHASSAPAIKVFGSAPPNHGHGAISHPLHLAHTSPNSYSARPMAIPNAREVPPPPLPPPRYIGALENGDDLGWRYGNQTPTSPHASVKPGSSLLAGAQPNKEYTGVHSPRYEQHDSRRGSTVSTVTPIDPAMMMDGLEHHSDDDHSSGKRPSLSNFSESQLGRKEIHQSSQAYDKHLLSRIGGPNAANDKSKFPGQLRILPDRNPGGLDSPLWRGQSAPSSGVSPGSGVRSPFLEQANVDSTFPSRVNSVSTPDVFDDNASSYRSHRNSDDHGVFLDPELTKMDGLDIHDRQLSGGDADQLGMTGVKRRASSPPSDGSNSRDDRASGSGNDLYARRSIQMLSKNSPIVGRGPTQYGSLSSTASLGPRTSSSFASTYNMSNASSLTSYSGERLSPGALSPSAEAEFGATSPYAASRAMNRSPHSLSKPPHQNRKPSEPSTDSKMATPAQSEVNSRQNSVSKPSKPRPWEGYPHVCQCCPKKPKKFDSEEELRMHEMEKQYQCAYCTNRFKNKNEAERHQNSLHLRRHSWSCAALGGVASAFHPSHVHPTTNDVCGYCGDEFPNNPPNWDARAEHLCQQHKFGECNQAKKFFRADHFRQHLKHSHAGTSGKWTNMLENACMKEEPTPAPLPPRNIVAPVAPMMMGGPQPPQMIGAPPIYTGAYPDIINESHEES